MLRVAIDDVVGTFSDRIYSHKSAWARMQKCMIEDQCAVHPMDENLVKLCYSGERQLVRQAHTWMISHDMAFDGAHYNLFGGWSNDIRESLLAYVEHPHVISLEHTMPHLEQCLRKRAEITKSNLTDAEWDAVVARCGSTPVTTHDQLVDGKTVVLGDSHALAQYKRGRLVLRNDGLTLHRLVEDGVRNWLSGRTPEHLVIVAGNIDLRHHLLRLEDPKQAVRDLYARLSQQLEAMCHAHEIGSFQVVLPYPIEFEGRRIPQTGFYKKTPFYGTMKERAELGEFMALVASGVFGDWIFRWPDKWYDIDPELYANTYMERPGSVHLSPAWHLWDYVNNQPNQALQGEYT